MDLNQNLINRSLGNRPALYKMALKFIGNFIETGN